MPDLPTITAALSRANFASHMRAVEQPNKFGIDAVTIGAPSAGSHTPTAYLDCALRNPADVLAEAMGETGGAAAPNVLPFRASRAA